MDKISVADARRIALASQGLDRPRSRGPVGPSHLASTIRQLGLVQVDFVNVLVPSHYLVPFSRLGPYNRSMLDDLIYRTGEFTEQWAHEASILPMETWPLLRHRMQTCRVRPWGFEKFLAENPDYVRRVLEEIRARGPLAADDLLELEGIPGVDRGQYGRIPGTWVGTVQRAVLEAHFARGLLAAAWRRPNFSRVYDLAERLVPAQHHQRQLSPEEADRELLRLAARAHGVGTAADLADYYRMSVRQARPRIAELVKSGDLCEVRVDSWREAAYVSPEAHLRKRSGRSKASSTASGRSKTSGGPDHTRVATLLSPFDPVVWFRARVQRLFEFDYRIEIFVPQAKRRWGYYTLPFLMGDRLVARVDLKADRPGRRLLVPAAYLEKHADPDAVAQALSRELRTLGAWLGLDSVVVGRRGDFSRRLAVDLKA